MTFRLKNLIFKGQKTSISLIMAGIILIEAVFDIALPQMGEAEPLPNTPPPLTLAVIQENTLLTASNLPESEPMKVTNKMNVVITAYSSTTWQTDDTPFITASGSHVKDGVVANNLLPFGTKIRMPEIYGDKVFTVEDRMHWSKSSYNLDIWFPDYYQALNFGVKRTYIEVLKN